MTGQQFEKDFCEILKKQGYWALNIPRNASGAQPFDVIAINDYQVKAFDCKVCATSRFPMSRIEDNQWLAFEMIEKKSSLANAGIVVFYNGNIYYLSNKTLKTYLKIGTKSIDLKCRIPYFSSGEIEQMIGRVLE